MERTIGIIQDVTGRKKAEEERNSLLDRERQAREWAERATRRMFVLEQASSALAASLDYEATLARITEIFVPNLADWCLVNVVDEDGAVSRVAQAHADPDKERLLQKMEDKFRNILSVPEVSETLQSGRPYLGTETGENLLEKLLETGDNGESPDELQKLEARSYMVVPLVARGRVHGAVTLVSSHPDRRYEREDLSLAEELANRCGLALEGARLYREQRYVARTLQRGLLLQDLPEIPGMEIGLEYLSVGGESEVGGDFYDLIDTHYDGWLCLLGDASGKGARAATSTALILYALRAVAFRGDNPSMVLSALNEAMLRQDAGNQFCTAICARLEPEECEGAAVKLTLARGGHPPPLLMHGDGSVDGSVGGFVEELGEPGRAIGIFKELGAGRPYPAPRTRRHARSLHRRRNGGPLPGRNLFRRKPPEGPGPKLFRVGRRRGRRRHSRRRARPPGRQPGRRRGDPGAKSLRPLNRELPSPARRLGPAGSMMGSGQERGVRSMGMFPTKILLATDGSPEAVLATRTAMEMAGKTGSELGVVHVEEVPVLAHSYAGREAEEGEATRARQWLEEHVGKIEEAGGDVAEAHLRLGRPAHQIVRLSEEVEAGLVVIGNQGLSAFRRFLMGSVSEMVVRYAQCPRLRGARRRGRGTSPVPGAPGYGWAPPGPRLRPG